MPNRRIISGIITDMPMQQSVPDACLDYVERYNRAATSPEVCAEAIYLVAILNGSVFRDASRQRIIGVVATNDRREHALLILDTRASMPRVRLRAPEPGELAQVGIR